MKKAIKSITRLFRLILGLFISLVCLSSCSNSKINIASIHFDNYIYHMKVNSYMKVEPIIEPANASLEDLVWESDDTSIAEVDNEGELFGKSIGITNIYAYDKNNSGNVKAAFKIQVEKAEPVYSFDAYFTKDTPFNEIVVSSEKHFISFHLSGSNDRDIRYFKLTPDDPSLVEIGILNNFYYLIAKNEGTVNIHVNHLNSEDTYNFVVHIKKPYLRAINLPHEYIYLITGSEEYDYYDLIPNLVTIGNIDVNVNYQSSNNDIVTVDSNGHLKAVKEGRSTITVSSGDISTYCEVIVSDNTEVTPQEGAIKLGEDEEERFKVNACIEKYAYNHFISGLPLMTHKEDKYSFPSYKLNLNTCNQLEWERYFGVGGYVCQTAKEDYWEVEPAMSNTDFLKGIRYAIDKVRLAEANDMNPKVDIYHNEMVVDSENQIYTADSSYRDSIYHQQVVNELIEGTDGYGYSFEKAKKHFINASNELINQGIYKSGDEIEIEISWQMKDQIQSMHRYIKEDLEKAFNVEENPLRLKVTHYVSDVWSDVYYKKAMKGQYDISFGTISGSTSSWRNMNLLPLCITNPNRNYWCLNYGEDTNDVTGDLVYDNKIYSFESLLTAVNPGVFVKRGEYEETPVKCLDKTTLYHDENGNLVIDVAFLTKYDDEIFYQLSSSSLYAFYYDNHESKYLEIKALDIEKCEENEKDESCYKIAFSNEEIAKLNNFRFEEVFEAGGIEFEFIFSLSYFSDFQQYGNICLLPANELVDNFSDLFA